MDWGHESIQDKCNSVIYSVREYGKMKDFYLPVLPVVAADSIQEDDSTVDVSHNTSTVPVCVGFARSVLRVLLSQQIWLTLLSTSNYVCF